MNKLNKKLLIMFCGGPASGKSTSFDAVVENLKESGISYSAVTRSNTPSQTGIALYKWASGDDESDVMLIDVNTDDVFTRSEMLEIVRSIVGHDLPGIFTAAVNHIRSNRFMLTHNQDTYRVVRYTSERMFDKFHRYQQPISKEGFDMIFDVIANDKLNATTFFNLIERKINNANEAAKKSKEVVSSEQTDDVPESDSSAAD